MTPQEKLATAEVLARLLEDGYRQPKRLGDGRYAGIEVMPVGYDIVAGEKFGIEWSYTDRWHYKTFREAQRALRAWDGVDEPIGWVSRPLRRDDLIRSLPQEERHAALHFLTWLIKECGYRQPKLIGPDRYAAIVPKMFTHAIVTGRIGDRISVGDTWCYRSMTEAQRALQAWDGTGEPQGWHRHPATGRRVSIAEDEIDDTGRKVGAVGVAYVRG